MIATGGGRTRWLFAAALALFVAVVGGGIAFRPAIFATPMEIIGERRNAFTSEERVRLLASNHAGAGPCLRYPTIRLEDLTDLGAAIEELVQHGFAAHAKEVTTLIRAWAQELELASHSRSPAEEELAMLRADASLEDRLAIALHAHSILATLATMDAPVSAESRRDAEQSFDAASLQQLTAIWKKHERALGGYPFPVGDRLVEQLSRDRVDALAELVRRRALLDRRFPASLAELDGATEWLRDGWGDPILYEASATSAKVSTRKDLERPTIEREIPLPEIEHGCDAPPAAGATVPGMFLDSSLDEDRMTYPGDFEAARPGTTGRRVFHPGLLLQSGGICDGDLLVSIAGEPWPDHLAQLRSLLGGRSEAEIVLARGPDEHHVVWKIQ